MPFRSDLSTHSAESAKAVFQAFSLILRYGAV
jgi:hypothetical protein